MRLKAGERLKSVVGGGNSSSSSRLPARSTFAAQDAPSSPSMPMYQRRRRSIRSMLTARHSASGMSTWAQVSSYS